MTGTADLVKGYQELQAALPGYGQADLMYDGDIEEVFTSPFVRRLLNRAGVESLEHFNYAHIPVDAIADRLRILSITAVDTEAVAAEQNNATAGTSGSPVVDAANKALANLIKRNQIVAEFDGLHLQVSKYGDAYLFVWPVTDDAGRTVGDVDIMVNSPTTVRALYNDENPLLIDFVIKSWTIPDPEDPRGILIRANLYYDDHFERWVTIPKLDGSDIEHWVEFEQEADDEGGVEAVAASENYPPGVDRVPFFHLRNFRPYGRPEHRNAYGPQQLIHKLVEAQAATIDFQTFPQRYLLMDPKADDFMQNLTDPFNSEDDAEDPEDPGNATQMRGDPAAIWRIYGAANAGEFGVANPENFLNPVDRYIRMMSETTGTPMFEFGMTDPPSGEALRAAREPLDDKVGDRQDTYGDVEADAFEFALHLLGFDVNVTISWKPTSRVNDAAGWNGVNQKIAAGVPVPQALIEAGYPQEQVEEWFSGEHAEVVDLQRRVALLVQVATAVQALSASIALGGVDQGDVKAIVKSILGDISPPGFDLEAEAAAIPDEPPPEWSRPQPPPMGEPPGRAGPPARDGSRPDRQERRREPARRP